MRAAALAMVFALTGCGGSSFSGAAAVDDAAADTGRGMSSDAAETGASEPPADVASDGPTVDGGSLAPDVDAAAADGDVHADRVDAGDVAEASTCTPLVTYTEPPTCACFFAGSCPYVDGGRSRDCIWAETPLVVTGQPTCRGCGLIAFPKNPCTSCRETFTCACLAPYLDPGQKCCDGPGGAYLSDYACP